MQLFHKIVLGIGFIALVFAVVLLSGTGTNTLENSDKMSDSPGIITNTTISGTRVNVYQGAVGNITFNATIPESPESINVYKGVFLPGDLIDVSPESSKRRGNVPSEEDAPFIAKQILEQYGGLPPDALLMGASTSYGQLRDPSTWEVTDRFPEDTMVSWWRKIDGRRIVGGGDFIQVLLGDNGAPLWIYKRWRTYSPAGSVPIIPVNKAIEKLGQGDVINPPAGNKNDVCVYGITLAYYIKGMEQPEVTLEPVWLFYGNTSDYSLMFQVYARQFANFTATPTSGKVPLTVTFTDTSDASPVKWNWSFGDGTTSAEQNPTHAYAAAGTYNVTLRVWNDLGSDTLSRPAFIVVTIPAPPVANFTATNTTGKIPLVVRFTDTSQNTPSEWNWSFGDGTVATGQNPLHTYTAAGNFTVSLTVTNDDGSDTAVRTNFITVQKPDDAITLIDQLITYIRNQNNVPKWVQNMLIGELTDVKYSLQDNHPDDAMMGMKIFKLTVNLFKGWPLTTAQASTMQTAADAIIQAINLPVNQQAIDQTKSLSAEVKGMNIQRSVEQSLLLELEGAVFNLECGKDQAAASHIDLFISTVTAQDGKKIPHDKAVQLIAKADAIKAIIKP